jgi:hypothetical protein
MADLQNAPGKKPKAVGENIIYWNPAECMPFDLFSYFREAGRCREESRFLAATAMSSTAIELILNRDRRLKTLPELRRVSGWATLNNGNLRVARAHGLPVQTLLSTDEDLGSDKRIDFVELRNKVAQGEISHLVLDLSDYDPDAARLAADQWKKMHDFIIEWFNTAPDVQDRHIQNYKWPDP